MTRNTFQIVEDDVSEDLSLIFGDRLHPLMVKRITGVLKDTIMRFFLEDVCIDKVDGVYVLYTVADTLYQGKDWDVLEATFRDHLTRFPHIGRGTTSERLAERLQITKRFLDDKP